MADLKRSAVTKVKEKIFGSSTRLNDLSPKMRPDNPLVFLGQTGELQPVRGGIVGSAGARFKKAAKWVCRNKAVTALYASAFVGAQVCGVVNEWSLFTTQTAAVGALASAKVLEVSALPFHRMVEDASASKGWYVIGAAAGGVCAFVVGALTAGIVHTLLWTGDDTKRPAINLVEEFKGAPVGAVRQDAAGNRYEYSEAFVAQEMARVDGKQLPVVTSGGKEVKKHFPVVRGNVTWDDSLTGKKMTREVLFCLPPVDGMPVMDGDKALRAPTTPVGKRGAPKIKFVEGNNPSACLQ